MGHRGMCLAAACLLAAGISTAQAQLQVGGDLLDNCSEIDALRKAGNFAEARDKAQLCLEGLEQQLEGELSQFFPTAVSGWMRTSFDQNRAMGFRNTSADYEKGGKTVSVSLTGGSGAGLGALGNLARLGALQGGRQVRVANLPAAVTPDGDINVSLEDGSLLSFSSSDFDDADSALAGMGDLVNSFPVGDLNAKLKEGK